MKSGWQILISAIWRKPVATLDKAAGSLRSWFATSMGQAILRREIPLIETLREDCSGEISLTVSPMGSGRWGKTPGAKLEIRLLPGVRSMRMDYGEGHSLLASDLEEIPLPDNSVDFILLHHTLEYADNPHNVLREAARVLAPRGHLLIVSFNPWSLFGLRASVERLVRLSVPWAHHRLSTARLTDWLYLMACEPGGVARGFYTLPVQSKVLRGIFGIFEPLCARLGLPGGGFFMIHATKNIFGRIQREPRRERPPRLMPLPVASPASRVVHLDSRKKRQ